MSEEEEGPCTDCWDTGVTIQTERRCACQPPLPVSEDRLNCAQCGKGEGFYQHAPFDESYHEFSGENAKDQPMSKETISMKEAVARAICIEAVKRGLAKDWTCQLVSDIDRLALEISDREWRKYTVDATAAIKAMGDATPAMVEAGEDAITYPADDIIRNRADSVWQAMIEAALSQE